MRGLVLIRVPCEVVDVELRFLALERACLVECGGSVLNPRVRLLSEREKILQDNVQTPINQDLYIDSQSVFLVIASYRTTNLGPFTAYSSRSGPTALGCSF